MRFESPRAVASSRGFLWVGAFALLAIALAVWPMLRPTGLLRDFSAFYCAGDTINAGRDPYLAEPLASCEHRPRPQAFGGAVAGLAIPAPLPPFALAGFALIARLPFLVAGGLWTLVLVAAFAASVAALRRLGVSTALTIPALGLTLGYASFALGQVAPIAIALIVLAAVLVEEGRARPAGVLVACALGEPHLALPALIALSIGRPASRLPILVTTALLGVAGILAVGRGPCAEYVFAVLPAHARSELTSTRQFSLTTVLAALHVPAAAALALGDLSYALAAAAGITAGLLLAKRCGGAMLVLAPLGFAVVGGPFVHVVQMAAATPLGVVLAARTERFRPWLEGATVMLASPWVQFATLGGILMPLAAIAACGIVLAYGRHPRIAAASAFAAVVFFIVIEALVTPPVADPPASALARSGPRALAEASWTVYVAAAGSTNEPAYTVARLPMWFGVLTIATVSCAIASHGKGSRGRRRIPRTHS